MIYKLIWMNLVLVFITSGYTMIGYALYIISFAVMFFWSAILATIRSEFTKSKKDGKPPSWENHMFIPDNFKQTKQNIICSTIIHLVIVFTQMGSIFLCIGLICSAIHRCASYKLLERETNG